MPHFPRLAMALDLLRLIPLCIASVAVVGGCLVDTA